MVLGKPEADGISASNGGMVLLVEDDDRISRLERFVLEQVGYKVTCAGSGEEALELLPQTTPSLVILDVMLPKMDGFPTCPKIRETSQVPIILVTAIDRDDDKVHGLEMGADDYITKPFPTHELASRVKSVLRRTGIDPGSNAPLSSETSKTELPFLHPRDEERSFPTQAPLTGPIVRSGSQSRSSISSSASFGSGNIPDPAGQRTKVFEGSVKLVVQKAGTVTDLIGFIDAIRQNPQIRLLRMISDLRGDCTDVWIRLRGPNPLQATLLRVAGVSRVEVVDSSESEPHMPVLNVSLH